MEYIISDKMKNLKPSAIREIFKSLTDPSIVSFAAGNPAAESFPYEAIKDISNDIFTNDAVSALQYSITEGYPQLREAVAKRQKDKFSIGADNDSTIITTGGQQGLELTCKVLCNEGDVVLCESPTFIGALNAFRSYGCKTVGIEMDDDGINTDALETALKTYDNVKMIYLIPTFQNPTGRTMSLEKRKKCFELAKKYSVVILEDNPYSELRFEGEDLPTIKSMDNGEYVVYCSSFSKILSAGMRVGFVIAPEQIASKIAVAKQCSDVHTNIFFQKLCYKYMSEYDMDAHIENIRAIYRRKSSLMINALAKDLSPEVKFTHPCGGLFIWCDIPNYLSEKEVIGKLIENKIAVVPGSTFGCDVGNTLSGFRLNYSTPSDEQITSGIKTLCGVVNSMLK